MVAARASIPGPPSSPPREAHDAPDFSHYDRLVDRGVAGFEEGEGSSRVHPLVHHEAFKTQRRLSLSERKEMAIKQAALRIACGLESRSLRELAKEIGCCHTAIDNRLLRVCRALGLHKFLASSETRARLRAARAKQTMIPR